MTLSTQINPEDLDGLGGNMWDHIRREYLSGVKAAHICQKWGISLSSFRMHARAGKWRRIDQPIGDVLPEAGEFHPEDDVSFADLADQAFLNIRRALGMGRASEASTWMRVYDRLCDRARAQVMADLPDIAPPRIESKREPLRLVGDGEGNLSDLSAMAVGSESERQDLDSLDSVFLESNPVSSPSRSGGELARSAAE